MLKPLKGLAQKRKKPTPPASRAGFEWPTRASADELKNKFYAAYTELLREKDIDHMKIAAAISGIDKTSSGSLAVNNASMFRNFSNGKGWPTPRTAGFIAEALRVPMHRLLEPKGKFKPGAVLRKGNGHDLEAPPKAPSIKHARMPVALLPRPDGAPPVHLKLETYAADDRFVSIELGGVAQVEVALALITLLHPEPRHEA
jgi:hypothetical protein